MKSDNKGCADEIVYVDVDWTLLIPEKPELFMPDSPNHKLIEQLKTWHSEGRSIIVWTSNTRGVAHCRTAAKVCGIEEYIYDYLPKPTLIVDDDVLKYDTMNPLTLEVRKE